MTGEPLSAANVHSTVIEVLLATVFVGVPGCPGKEAAIKEISTE